MQPAAGPIPPGAGEGMLFDSAASPEMVKLIEQLQKLDAAAPKPEDGVRALGQYNARRADILAKLFELSRSDEEREQWGRQLIDGIATAVQMETYPEGLERLRRIEGDLKDSQPDSMLLPYAAYRRMLSQYSQDLQDAEAEPEERQKVLDRWLEQLEEFVDKWPDADDTPDALLQLAITQEFAGKIDEARSWYDRLINRHGDTVSGAKAAGAVRRIDLEGKRLSLSGSNLNGGSIDISRLQGRVVLVLFWSTWCKPCTEDLPQLKQLYQEHRRDGFEIVGVNLDNEPDPVKPFLAQHQVVWPQIYEPGGLDSAPAKSFGIISLPTMFLIDRTGMVVSRSTSVPDLKEKLPELLKKK
jgi:thiol-disulfide isomerase/thioredoxin